MSVSPAREIIITNSSLPSSHLDKVHDICPSLQRDDKEDGHPGQANVIKRDGSVKRIGWARGASGVILKSEVSKYIS